MKKYIVTLELNLLANSDAEAVSKARQIVESEKQQYDNDCLLTKLHRSYSAMSVIEIDLAGYPY